MAAVFTRRVLGRGQKALGVHQVVRIAGLATQSSRTPAAVPVWLDCDPGHDDMMAIILAGHSDRIDLLGISTVAGNMPLEATTKNALRTLHTSGLDHVPVYAGASQPLIRAGVACPEIHGLVVATQHVLIGCRRNGSRWLCLP